MMSFILSAVLIGFVAGLRSMTAPAAVSWAARLGWIPLVGTPLAFLGSAWAPWLFTIAAAGEWIADKLPNTPSRKKPASFVFRIISGSLCGAAIGYKAGNPVAGLSAGAVGAVAGTLIGAELRKRLALALGKDLPIALLEDVVAIGAGFAAVYLLA